MDNKEERIHKTSPFKDCIFSQNEHSNQEYKLNYNSNESTPRVPVGFTTYLPRLVKGDSIKVCGSIEDLGCINGHWKPEYGLELKPLGNNYYGGVIHLPVKSKFEWKLVIETEKDGNIWHEGPNNLLSLNTESVLIQCGRFESEAYKGRFKGFGVAIPVFSLRSAEDFGVGEFLDLIPFLDYLRKLGGRICQILPITDTRVFNMWWDSYPYSPLSAFALHPMYLRIPEVEGFDNDICENYENIRKEFNEKFNKSVEYEKVLEHKLKFISQIFKEKYGSLFEDDCEVVIFDILKKRSPAMLKYYKENEHWLVPYASFLYYAKLYGTTEFKTWKEHSVFNVDMLEEVVKQEEFWLNVFIQYNCHLQMSAVFEHANNVGCCLKGDIPIGVSPNSVDAWWRPDEFVMDESVGAPPDQFSANGQNWLFPPYNWEAMEANDFEWWITRLQQSAHYFHAFRVDHVLGLFRIWQIPRDNVHATLGRYHPTIEITEDDLKARNLWDIDRYCNPHITEHTLHRIAAKLQAFELLDVLKQEYIKPKGYGGEYEFRIDYANEHELLDPVSEMIENARRNEEDYTQFDKLFKFLMFLYNNRIMSKHEVNGKTIFVPLFDMKEADTNCKYSWIDSGLPKDNLEDLWEAYHYGPHQNELWRNTAYKRLIMLTKATGLLLCGEDLGALADCVAPTMNEFDMLGLRVQRFPPPFMEEAGLVNPNIKASHPDDYEWMTVSTSGTHDMPTLRGWFTEKNLTPKEHRQRDLFYCDLCGFKKMPAKNDQEIKQLTERVLDMHLFGPSMWTIFPLQDLLYLNNDTRFNGEPEEEMINIPAIQKHYWKYRLHISIEDLEKNHALVNKIRSKVEASGRDTIY
eukprot:TRINITY_DN3214_c0_g1_i1.p1 TRINITY_DN3214_c0_g1~~TRINITY_DN3214_c0_g1_i1.p1  ORF type:complete len:970 (+),score=291.11 TRINITY_DN3214_c0_g1_i1:337-2910(+)